MSYRKSKIAVVGSKEGYNDAAKLYKTFHKEMNAYDKGLFQRFLPRSLAGKSVLDLGAGDARMYKYFQDKSVRYVAMDVAEKLLKQGPSRIEKVVADIDGDWPFADEEFDIELCFFVILHISDLGNLFEEAYRTLKPGGKLVILQNYQRRSYEYNFDGKNFKIQDRSHSEKEIIDSGEAAFFTEEHIELFEKDVAIGMLYCFTK